jgi:hypothetical protein
LRIAGLGCAPDFKAADCCSSIKAAAAIKLPSEGLASAHRYLATAVQLARFAGRRQSQPEEAA